MDHMSVARYLLKQGGTENPYAFIYGAWLKYVATLTEISSTVGVTDGQIYKLYITSFGSHYGMGRE
jgi:hypothetical protein